MIRGRSPSCLPPAPFCLLLARGREHGDIVRAAGIQGGLVLLDAADDALLIHHRRGHGVRALFSVACLLLKKSLNFT
jgi:hypothetical protein